MNLLIILTERQFIAVLFILNCFFFANFSFETESGVNPNITLSNSSTDLYLPNSSSLNETNFSVSEMPENKSAYDDASETDHQILVTSLSELDCNSCGCNLIDGICEALCCCDKIDCNDEDLKSFKNCKEKGFNSAENFCFKRDILFKSQLDFIDINTDKSCIILEDSKTKNDDINEPTISFDEFELLKSTSIDFLTAHYKIEMPIYIKLASENYRKPVFLGFPHSVAITDVCSGFQLVTYLKDEAHFCFQKLLKPIQDCHHNIALNASTYYKDFEIITDIEKILKGKDDHQAFNNYSTTEVKSFLCKESFDTLDSCIETTIPPPNLVTPVCENIVSEVLYNIIHSGIKGIQTVNAYFVLKNLTFVDYNMTYFKQFFKVIHTWKIKSSSYNATNKILPVSNSFSVTDIKTKTFNTNRLGYIFEESALAARYDSDSETLNQYLSKYLTIPMADVNGNCQLDLKMPILFGENAWSGCKLNIISSSLEEHCEYLMKNACSLIKSIPFPSHISLNINSSPNDDSDWVDVFNNIDMPCEEKGENLINRQRNACKGIIFSPHMNIFYALIGSKAKPRLKIVNVFLQNLKYEERIHMQYKNNLTFEQSFMVTFSISFTDMTQV